MSFIFGSSFNQPSGAAAVSGASSDSNLRTTDINPPKRKFTNRVVPGSGVLNSSLATQDINGLESARRRRRKLKGNKPDPMDVSDISGAKPRAARVPKRNTNPLDPQYKLPKAVTRPVSPPKFIRDNLDVSDIAKAKSHKDKRAAAVKARTEQELAARDPLNVNDIDGARPKRSRFAKMKQRNTMDTRDITHPQFKSKRVTNPLQPNYKFAIRSSLLDNVVAHEHGDGDSKEQQQQQQQQQDSYVVLGTIDGSRPRGLRRERKKDEQFALQTQDISKTYSKSWQRVKAPRGFIRDPIKTSDIPGAQADSKRKRRFVRDTNPLMPDYDLPGHMDEGHVEPGHAPPPRSASQQARDRQRRSKVHEALQRRERERKEAEKRRWDRQDMGTQGLRWLRFSMSPAAMARAQRKRRSSGSGSGEKNDAENQNTANDKRNRSGRNSAKGRRSESRTSQGSWVRPSKKYFRKSDADLSAAMAATLALTEQRRKDQENPRLSNYNSGGSGQSTSRSNASRKSSHSRRSSGAAKFGRRSSRPLVGSSYVHRSKSSALKADIDMVRSLPSVLN